MRKKPAAPSRAALKRLHNLSKGAVKMLMRVYAGHFYPTQFPVATGHMKELVDARFVRPGGRIKVMASYYVPVKAKPFKIEKFPPMPNWMKKICVERTQKSQSNDVKG